MAKDAVQELVDEITLVRGEVKQLQRTSLSRDEAKALNAHVAQALAQMKALAAGAPQAVRNAIWTDLRQLDQTTSQAASKAAGQAVKDVREDLRAERANLLRASERAHRAAWRFEGGVWAWMAATLATGALLGALAALWMTGKDDAREFGRFPRIYCEDAGGTIFADTDGRRFCGIWIDPPVEATQ